MVVRYRATMAPGWPLLRRAPSRMLHSGALTVMILVSVALLAGLVSAGPLFASATSYAALERRLSAVPESAPVRVQPAVQVTGFGPTPEVQSRIEALIGRIPYLGPPRTTLVANSWRSANELGATPYIRVGGVRLPALLYSRTDAVAGLQVVSGRPGAPGLWLPEPTARQLGVRPGSAVQVGKTYRYTVPNCGAPFFRLYGTVSGKDYATGLTVAGTYRTGPDGRTPLGPYFSRITSTLPGDPGHCAVPGVLLIGDLPLIRAALDAVHEESLWSTSATLSPAGWRPERLRRAAAGAQSVRLHAGDPDGPIHDLVTLGAESRAVQTGLPGLEQQVASDSAVADRQGRGIAYAGAVVGLAAIVLALRALAERRRRETELLLGVGTPTAVVVLAAMLELLIPAVLGAGAGLAGACLLFSRAGPHPGLDPAAVTGAAEAAGLVAAATLVSMALIVLGQTWRFSRTLSGLPAARHAAPWLPMLTGATALALYATLSRDPGRSYQDPLAALLPILVLACGCAILARAAAGVGEGVRRLRPGRTARSRAARPRRAADRLVLRGLRGTGVKVSDLVIVLSVGVGVLTYGLIAHVAVNQSVVDKAAVLAGAPSSAHIRHSWLLGAGEGPSPRLPRGTTVVWRAPARVWDDTRGYDVLVVNPPALREAASWGSGPELAAARAALADLGNPTPASLQKARKNQTPVPALLVGPPDPQIATTAVVEADLVRQRVGIRRRLTAFPGAVRPTVVVDARSFFPRLKRELDPSNHDETLIDTESNFVASVWTRESLPALRAQLVSRGIPVQETGTLARARATPELLSSRWAVSYQALLGLAAAVLAGLAMVISVDRRVARAAPADLMVKRFGITPARLLRLRAAELVATCLAALLVAAVPLAAMVVLLPRLIEPDTSVPPAMPVRVTAGPVLIGVAVAVVVTVVAALAAARRSGSVNPGEVLRDDA